MNGFKWTDIWKNKFFCVAAALEAIILAAGIAGLFQPAQRIELNPGQENISLKPGVYQVTLEYRAAEDGNELQIYDMAFESGTLLFSTVSLYAGENREDCQLWVLRNTDTVRADVVYNGSGELTIKNFHITSTNAGSRILIFLTVVVGGILNGLFLLRLYDAQIGIERRKKLLWAVLAAAFVCMSLPLLVDYHLWGNDWGFHMLRIEGLISGWKDGQFPVRIQGNWLRGYGYAVSVFYSDLFLVIPALLRLIGFTVNTAALLYMAVIHGATLLISYQCFRRCFHNDTAGAVSAVLYSLSAYRMHNIYVRYALGETLAMVFLPMVFYGFYRIFMWDIQDKSYRRSFLVLTLGLTGVIQSHVLTCEMLAFCIILVCLLLIRKVFRKKTFWELTKAAVFTILLNLWYLVPFLDYFLTGNFNVSNTDTMVISQVQKGGIYPAHSLFLFYGRGKLWMGGGAGMYETAAYSVGAALLLALIVWVYLEFTQKFKNITFRFLGLGRLMFGLTCLFTILTSRYFPWQRLEGMGGLIGKLVVSLQFPYRFLALSCLTSSILSGVILIYFRENSDKEVYRGWTALFFTAALFFCAYQVNHLLISQGFARVYNREGMGTTYISNAEYLPYLADVNSMLCNLYVPGEAVTVEAYEKGKDTLRTKVTVSNAGDDSYVELPILYYRGYTARNETDGERLQVTAGTNSVVRVLLPGGYQGSFRVFFQSPWYWRVAECISILTAAGIFVVVFFIGAVPQEECKKHIL